MNSSPGKVIILNMLKSTLSPIIPPATTDTIKYLHTIMETHRLHASVAPTNFLVQEEPLAEPSTQTEMAYALCQCQMNVEFKIFHQQRAC